MVATLTFDETTNRHAGIDRTRGARGAPDRRREADRHPKRVPTRAELRARRIVAGAAAAGLVLCLFLGVQAMFGRPGGGPLASVGSPRAVQPAAAEVWVVRPGDTLWTIALASGAEGDIRPLVDRLSAEVGGRPLQPGERIVVP